MTCASTIFAAFGEALPVQVRSEAVPCFVFPLVQIAATIPDVLELAEGKQIQDTAILNLIGGLELWNMFYFSIVGNAIIPTDFHIFRRGRYTTH